MTILITIVLFDEGEFHNLIALFYDNFLCSILITIVFNDAKKHLVAT